MPDERPQQSSPPAEPSAPTAWYQNKKLVDFVDIAQKLIVIFGVPVGIYTYMDTKDKERQDAEWAAYEKIDERYWTYERMAMDYPQLDVSDAGASDAALSKLTKSRAELTPAERIRERQLMFLLIAMYERAYILYANKSTEFKKEQWTGWENGLKRWILKPGFREAWEKMGEDFDEKFQQHVNALIAVGPPKKK